MWIHLIACIWNLNFNESSIMGYEIIYISLSHNILSTLLTEHIHPYKKKFAIFINNTS